MSCVCSWIAVYVLIKPAGGPACPSAQQAEPRQAAALPSLPNWLHRAKAVLSSQGQNTTHLGSRKPMEKVKTSKKVEQQAMAVDSGLISRLPSPPHMHVQFYPSL